MKYDIQANPYNPVEYLACCGIFEILSRFDGKAVSWWDTATQPHYWVESEIAEAALLLCLKQTLADWGKWQSSTDQAQEQTETEGQNGTSAMESADAADENDEGNEGTLLSPSFYLNNRREILRLDWWYETLKPDKTIKKKSAWKMYAGQQTAEKIMRDMTVEAGRLIQQDHIESISALLRLSAGMTGRFGFDPRSSRNALDTGFSANDLNLPIATYPFTEMLASIGAHYFFPHRTRQDGSITSTRGWIEDKVFQYALWQTPLSIVLARPAVSGAAIQQAAIIPLRAGRANRDKYSNFKMATAAVWQERNPGKVRQ
jgi:CRISPR-associated protein Csb3